MTIMNFVKALIILGLAFGSSIHVDAKSSKSVGSSSKSGKGSSIVSNEKGAGTSTSTIKQSNAANVITMGKSGKSNDISPDMTMAKSAKAGAAFDMSLAKSGKAGAAYDISMAKSGKADAAVDMSMAKSGKANVSDEMSMMDNRAYIRKGGKAAKHAKSYMSLDN